MGSFFLNFWFMSVLDHIKFEMFMLGWLSLKLLGSTFVQATASLWERTTCSALTTRSRLELNGRKHRPLRPPSSLWTGRLLSESSWRNRASTWSRKWRKGIRADLHLLLERSRFLFLSDFITTYFLHLWRLTEMEILYKKEKEEADQLLEQQRLVSWDKMEKIKTHLTFLKMFERE